MRVPGKDDPWPLDPWTDRSETIPFTPQGGVGFCFAATPRCASGKVQIDTVIPMNDRMMVFGEVVQTTGYTGGQSFLACFSWSGAPGTVTYFEYKNPNNSRLSAFAAQPLPNGNVLIAHTVNDDTTYMRHIIVSEIDRDGNIQRGGRITVRLNATVNPTLTAVGLVCLNDPWRFVLAAIGAFIVFDARSMTIEAMIGMDLGYPSNMFSWPVLYDPYIDSVWMACNRTYLTYPAMIPVPVGATVDAVAQFTGYGLPVHALGQTGQRMARWGEYLFWVSTLTPLLSISATLGGVGKRDATAYRWGLTPIGTLASPESCGMVATDKAVYLTFLNKGAGRYFYIVEVCPNDLRFETAVGSRCRVIRIYVNSTLRNWYSLERRGNLLFLAVNSGSTAGIGAGYLFSFDDVWGGGFADNASVTQNQGGFSLAAFASQMHTTFVDAASVISTEEWALKFIGTHVPLVNAITVPSRVRTYRGTTTSFPVYPSATYYTQQAAGTTYALEIGCFDFLRRSSL